MDIVEFAEKFYGVEFKEWQRIYLRAASKLSNGDVRVVANRKGLLYIYPDKNTLKELTKNG